MPQNACISCSSVHPFRGRKEDTSWCIRSAKPKSDHPADSFSQTSCQPWSLYVLALKQPPLLPPQVVLSFWPSLLQPLLQERLFLPGLRHWPPLWLPSLLGMLQIFISSALRALYTWQLGVSIRVTFTTRPCLTTSYLPAKRHNSLFPIYLFHLFPTAYYPLEVIPLIYLLIGLFSISTLPP